MVRTPVKLAARPDSPPSTPGSAGGSVVDINDYGDMVGIYGDPALRSAHGFLLKAADEGAYPYGRVRTALKSIFGIDPIRLGARGCVTGRW